MHEKMQLTSEPYFLFIDSDNQIMAYAGDNEGSVKVPFTASADNIRPNEAGSNNSVDRLDNEDNSGSGFLQNDPFQLTENSQVLSCLPQCERELLHSATMETLSAELEMDVCDTLQLPDNGAAVEQSAAAVSDADNNLLAGVKVEKMPAWNGIVPEDVDEQEHSSSLRGAAEPGKSGDTDSDSSKGQQWPMATSLDNGHLQCNVCSKELRVTNYYPHMRRVHKMPSNRSRPIMWKVCDRCGYQCQDNYKLRRHAMKHTRYGKFCSKLFKQDLEKLLNSTLMCVVLNTHLLPEFDVCDRVILLGIILFREITK